MRVQNGQILQRAMLNQDFDDDDGREDGDDEQPTIVVLKEGDLTAEQVKAEKEKNKGKTIDKCSSSLKKLTSTIRP